MTHRTTVALAWLLAAVAACAPDPEGTYEADRASVQRAFAEFTGRGQLTPTTGTDGWKVTLTLRADGSYTHAVALLPGADPMVEEGTWTRSGAEIELTPSDQSRATRAILGGDKIVFTSPDQPRFELHKIP